MDSTAGTAQYARSTFALFCDKNCKHPTLQI